MTFKGIIPATITPYGKDGRANPDAMHTIVNHQIEAGVDGLFICGSTGEWWLLDVDERQAMAAAAVDAAAGRVPVMVHIGANTTAESVRLAQHAEQVGADAISALPPIGRPYPPACIWQHFKDIGSSCGLPLYLYHLPQIYGDLITIDKFVGAIEEIPTLKGAKFSSYQIDDLIELVIKAGDQLNIISGCGEQLMSAIGAGADGSICTWWNLIPKLGRAVITELEAGNVAGARKLQHKIVAFGRAGIGNGGGNAKRLTSHRVVEAGQLRPPAPRVSDEDFAAYLERLSDLEMEEWLI